MTVLAERLMLGLSSVNWWVSICLLLVRLSVAWSVLLSQSIRSPFVGFVSVIDKSSDKATVVIDIC